jgi:CRISPR-associated endonuclease/helicase Cas3
VQALSETDSGMIIVNNRIHALELYQMIAHLPGARHLSTSMTIKHRQDVLALIRRDLNDKRPVRLISTSLVEAGVDISFKKVWRAMAGLESIIQAAGRCNRNGELGRLGGILYVFEPEPGDNRNPPPELKRLGEVTKMILTRFEDVQSLKAITEYFQELYYNRGVENLDTLLEGGVLKRLYNGKLHHDFASVGKAFHLINDRMVPVIIPENASKTYGISRKVLDDLKFHTSAGFVARTVQPYTVQIPRSERAKLIARRSASRLDDAFEDQFIVLDQHNMYGEDYGLDWKKDVEMGIESLVN